MAVGRVCVFIECRMKDVCRKGAIGYRMPSTKIGTLRNRSSGYELQLTSKYFSLAEFLSTAMEVFVRGLIIIISLTPFKD